MDISKEYQKSNISQWADEDKPREKLMAKGSRALSDAELIAILISTGTRELTAVDLARQVLQKAGNDLNSLAKLSVQDLKKIKGVGTAKAVTIVSALELGRRRTPDTSNAKERKIQCSQDAYECIKAELSDLKIEETWVLLLNQQAKLIAKLHISTGGISSTIVDPKVVLSKALEHSATALILIHNHPSGTLKPSDADNKLTKKLKDACTTMDIRFNDHLIFTDAGYFSYADEGFL
jgi:DNA repair protein RadC